MQKTFIFLMTALLLNTVHAVQILHPVKITGSSFFKTNPKREYHGPELTGDGKTGDIKSYWASDLKNNAKPPHEIVFEFGKAVTFNAVRLDMVERYNFSVLCNDFSIDCFDGQKWKNLVNVKGYTQRFFAAMRSAKPEVRYGTPMLDSHPVFSFDPVTGTKVRFITWDRIARLDEMTVMQDWTAPAPVKNPPPAASNDGVLRYVFAPAGSAFEHGFLPAPIQTASNRIYFCDRGEPDRIRRRFAAGMTDARMDIPVKQSGIWRIFLMGGDQFSNSPGTELAINGKTFRIPSAPSSNFPWIVCTVDVQKEINILLKGSWLLNTIVAAPLTAEKAFDEAIRQVIMGKDIKRFKLNPQPTHNAAVPPSPAQIEQGYINFTTSIDQRVFVTTPPEPGQAGKALRAQGASDTFKAVTTSFRFLKNIPDFNVSWSGPLKATLHPVRNWLQRSGHKGASRIFAFVPEVLEENAPCYALKGNTKQYYLIFEIPAGSKPGIFTGKLTVTGKGIPARDIPVEFKVLPFRLPRIDNRQYAAMYHADFYRPFLRPGSDSGLDRARLLDMRRHNMNSILYPLGKFPGKDAFKKQYLTVNRMLDECGFPRFPMPWSNLQMTAEDVKSVQEVVKETGLREILYYPVDEPHFGKRHIAEKLYPMVKQIPGTRTYSTVSQQDVDSLGKYLDFRTYMITGYARFEPDRIARECAGDKANFFWYSNSAREYPAPNRFKAGYFAWRCGGTGQLYWAYDNVKGDAWNDFDSTENDHNAVYIEDGRILSTLQWEGIREGLDDFRYIAKLEQCIADAPETPAAREGKALLAEIRQATVVDLNEYRKRFGLPIDIHQYCIWKPGKMDEYRNRIIAAILKFRK